MNGLLGAVERKNGWQLAEWIGETTPKVYNTCLSGGSSMRTQETQGNVKDVVLAVSLELAPAKWKVALHDRHRESPSIHTVAQTDPATRLQAVLALIATQKQAWALPDNTRVVVSYEAGQDPYWIFEALQARGIECYVIDPASIPVQRQNGAQRPTGST
jgi:transposase